MVPCFGSVSAFGPVSDWFLLWFSWFVSAERCFYLVPFGKDGDFRSDDWLALMFHYLDWVS